MLRCVIPAVLLLCAAAPAWGQWEIRVWHALRGAQAAEFEHLAGRFNAAQQEYRVVPVYRGSEEDAVAAALAPAQLPRPHLVLADEAATADLLASREATRPLWQVMAEAGERLEPEYFAAVTAHFSDAQGRLVAFPFSGATPLLYYNRGALRRAQLDPAKPPATWHEMAGMLGALIDSGAACGLTVAQPSWALLENMSAWHGQEFATHHNGMDAGEARLSFNTRLMVRWISMLSSWHKSGYFTYSGRGDEAEARFAAGECAFLVSSSASYAELRRRAGFVPGVAPLPHYDDFEGAPRNTLVGAAALWILEGKPKLEYRGAARFLAYLAQPEVQAEWHRRTGAVPLTRAAYHLGLEKGFYEAHPGQEVAVRQLFFNDPGKDSSGIRVGHFRSIRRIIHEELESVFAGRKAPLEALNAAVERGNALLSAARRVGEPR